MTSRFKATFSQAKPAPVIPGGLRIGFGVRAYATGSKVYVVQTRANGRSRRLTLGRHGIISAEEARKRAALVISRIMFALSRLERRTSAA